MPFLALLDGERVIPEGVPDGVDLVCPSCKGRLRPRGPFSDGRARHFYHVGNSGGDGGGGCSGGESDMHRKLKSLVVSALRTQFSDTAAEIGPEQSIDVSDTTSSPDIRQADALVRFQEPHETFGDGLAVEVQYRNKGKDIEATTHDYLDRDISVFWADPDDFHDEQFEIEQLVSAFESPHNSEAAYSAIVDTPPPILDVDVELNKIEDLEGLKGYFLSEDPVPGCRHEFVKPPEDGEPIRCLRCGLVADLEGNGPTRTAWADFLHPHPRGTVSEYKIQSFEEMGKPPDDHYHRWSSPDQQAIWTQYTCRCGAKMFVTPDVVRINHG